MLSNRAGEIGDVTILTIPPALGQSSKPVADAFRAFHQLAPVDFARLKFPPETKHAGIESQRIASEALLFPVRALIQNRLQIAFQMSPAQL